MHLLRLLLTLLAVPTHPAPAIAPDTFPPEPAETLSCGADEMNAGLRETDKSFAARMDSLEAAWANRQPKDAAKSTAPPYVLPIVFHIVHENGPENLPDADILRGVDYLNQALANTGYYDPATGVNTQIQVCLARRSPDNEATNGINRIVSPLTNLSSNDDRELKDLSRWAPRDYVNVWVVKEACGLGLGCGLAGYANYPGGHGSRTDGIVLEARWLADDEADLTVLVHELGHYLGVRHTFDGGCANDDCLRDGDRVCDTPPDQSTVAVPCTGSANSCATDTDSGPFATDQDDMHINYMDYGYFRCYSAFTAGQRERMHFFLEGTRRSLLESRGCEEPCPAVVTAGFTGGAATIQAGETITFVNTSVNGDRFEWYRGGTLISTDENLTYQFDEEGFFRIRLVVYPADSILCEPEEVSQRFRVVCEVTASFSTPPSAPDVDSMVIFNNTSSGGGTSEWTVDGTVVSTDRDLAYVFPSPDRYRVCLTETNGFCEDERCISVFVRPPLTDPDGDPGVDTSDCNGLFSYSYALPQSQQSGSFSAVVSRGDTLFTLARMMARTYVMAILESGQILWQTELIQPAFSAAPSRLILDGAGMLAGMALSSGNTDEFNRALVFRLSPDNGQLLWAKAFRTDANLEFSSIIDASQNDRYQITGRSFNTRQSFENYQIQLNREDGNFSSPVSQFSGTGSFYAQEVTAVNGSTGSYLLTAGTHEDLAGTRGVVLIKTDSEGIVQESRIISSETAGGGPMSFGDIVLINEGDSLAIGTLVFDEETSIRTVRLCKTGPNGEPGWTKDYRIPTLTDLIGISQNNTGYLVLMDSGLGTMVMQTDFSGEVVWTINYSNLEVSLTGPDGLTVAGNQILIAGARISGGRLSPTVVRLGNDGSPFGSCTLAGRLDIVARHVPNTQRPHQISSINTEFDESSFGAAPSDFRLLEDLACREDCPEEEDSSCARPFVRTYGPSEVAPNLAPYEINYHIQHGENLIIAGRDATQTPFVAVLGPQGEVYGTRMVIIDQPGYITDLIIDAEGYVCGVGTAGSSGNGGLFSFAFRLDPGDGIVPWVRTYAREGRSLALTKLHHTPGDNFLRAAGYGEADPGSAVSNGVVARISLDDGEFTGPPVTYSDPGETSFRAFDKHPGGATYFALANVQPSSAGTPQLARLNADGTVIFNKQYAAPEIGQAVEMVVTDSTVTMLCQRNGGGFALVQTDVSGNLRWQRNYPNVLPADGLTCLADGFLVWLRSTNTLTAAFLRLDDAGNVLWATERPGPVAPGLADVLHVTATATNMTISTINGFGTADHAIALTRTDLSGTFDFGCETPTNPILASVAESRTVVTDVPLTLGETSFSTDFIQYGGTDLVRKDNCAGDCTEPEELVEICDNNLDDDGDGLADCDDPDLSNDCCCFVAPEFIFFGRETVCNGINLNFFAQDNWRLFRSIFSGDTTTTDLVPNDGYLFFFFDEGTHFLEIVDECGNVSSDTLIVAGPSDITLDLGPDTTVCENAIITLRAQSGFESYEWTDGSTEETFTTFGEGDFWVVATDSCGFRQTDTVTVAFDDATVIDLGADRTICPGDTLAFRLEGYTDIQWSQSSFIDCFDCPEVRFAPTMDTLLLVAAKQGPGCFSSDSLRVRIKSLVGARDTVFLCPGDTAVFGDRTITEGGQYYDITDESRCPVVDTLDVFALRDTLISDEVVICAGDSALVFGAFEREADTYFRISTGYNGCDSTNQVILTVRQPVATSETLSICAGDSALVFGVFERVPGQYFRVYTGQNGCDSTHQITLETNDLATRAVQLRPDCGGAAAGAGEVIVQSNDLPVSIRWSDGTLTALNENLLAGTYSVTVTSQDGCSVSTELVITDAPSTELAPAAAPETCPGENDGSVAVPNAPAGFLFQLNNGTEQAEPFFGNLAPGTYQLTARDTFGCPQTFTLTVAAAGELLFELPTELSVQLGDSVTLSPTVLEPAGTSVSWLADDGTACPACPTLNLRPENNLTVTAVATDANGCSETRTVGITVDRQKLFYLPNAFSPNGDRVNDVFRLYPGPGVERILSFAVFDRWGGRVFFRQDVDPTDALGHWDGTSAAGTDPTVGVYVYAVEVRLFSGEVITRAGEVLLMR